MSEGPHTRPCSRRRLIAAIPCALLGRWLPGAGGVAAALPVSAGRPRSASAPMTRAAGPAYDRSPQVEAFAVEAASRRGLAAAWILEQLAQARRQPAVERAIMPPAPGTAKNWAAYRDRFVEPRRTAAGLSFWQEHAAALSRAEDRWGVPPEIVVGIIGVETFYGRHMGSFRVIDALATLSFDFPPGRRDRSAFFRSELEEFLVLCQREGTDPQQPRGSFAGAMGLPQFMPGSINRYAVDFDESGRVDLTHSAVDAIGSVAHYLAAFGWERGVPTHFDVAVPVDVADRAVLLGPDIVPSFTPAQFAQRGAELPPAARAHDGLLALVMLENGEAAPTHVAGTRNFYAITRYNWSSYYALAVITLGAAVRQARGLTR
jgi:membrane-bound lytic murein transglycosylase B